MQAGLLRLPDGLRTVATGFLGMRNWAHLSRCGVQGYRLATAHNPSIRAAFVPKTSMGDPGFELTPGGRLGREPPDSLGVGALGCAELRSSCYQTCYQAGQGSLHAIRSPTRWYPVPALPTTTHQGAANVRRRLLAQAPRGRTPRPRQGRSRDASGQAHASFASPHHPVPAVRCGRHSCRRSWRRWGTQPTT